MSQHRAMLRAYRTPRAHNASRFSPWGVRLALTIAMLFFASAASLADWNLPVDASPSATLVDPWENYFGIHYLQVDEFEPEWLATPPFKTVRDYAFPGLPRIQTEDGGVYDVTQMSRYIEGNPLVGPFTGEPVYAGLTDVANGRGVSLADTLPDILANDLTVVFTAESIFPPSTSSSVDKDYIYWTLRQTYEAFPEAVDNIIWQWGNEINANGDWFSPARENDPAGVPLYVNTYLAPAIEAVQRVEADLIANGTLAPDAHIPIATGSFITISTAGSRAWMTDVMESTITDQNVSSPDIVGKQVWELVDIATAHYPGTPNTLEILKQQWLDTNNVESVWITEDHGQRGEGPADLASRAIRYIDWVIDSGLDSDTSRTFWWSTNATDDPGGPGIEAVDLLGSLFAGQTLYETLVEVDGIEAYVVLALDSTGEGSLTLVAVPEEYPRNPASPVTPGEIVFELPDNLVLTDVGSAELYQFSIEQPTESWRVPVRWQGDSSSLALSLLDSTRSNPHSFSETMLVTLPVRVQRVPEPSSLMLLGLALVAVFCRFGAEAH